MSPYSIGQRDALLKFAAIFGATRPRDMDVASIPYEHRRDEMQHYLKAKAQEGATNPLIPVGMGGLLGGGVGGLLGGPGGALLGAGLGAGGGGLLSALDHSRVNDAQTAIAGGQTGVEHALNNRIRGQRRWRDIDRSMSDSMRHQELLDAVESR